MTKLITVSILAGLHKIMVIVEDLNKNTINNRKEYGKNPLKPTLESQKD